MKIEELKNQRVKLADRSITCKDRNGKTKGVVTNVTRFRALQPNKAVDYFKQIKAAGLWGSGESDRVYIIDGKIYYLFNLSPIEFYEKYYSGKSGFDDEKERYKQRKKIAEEAGEIVTVIPCYII